MNTALTITSSFSTAINPPLHRHLNPSITPSLRCTGTLTKPFTIKATSTNQRPTNPPHISISPLKTAACAFIFAAAALSNFPAKPAIATPLPSQTLIDELSEPIQSSPLTSLLQSNTEAVEALKKLLQEKLESGEDDECLSILRKLVSAQPDNAEWQSLIARVLNELGRLEEARDAYEVILKKNPLSIEALFENALLMDKSGESAAVMRRLEEALRVAENENKTKEGRDVRLIMAQMLFLHKNVDEALRSYEELEREDPKDFRPPFCKGMIYSLTDRNEEAREMFAKYRELSPKEFEVEGYLRTPLSRMKLFGANEKY